MQRQRQLGDGALIGFFSAVSNFRQITAQGIQHRQIATLLPLHQQLVGIQQGVHTTGEEAGNSLRINGASTGFLLGAQGSHQIGFERCQAAQEGVGSFNRIAAKHVDAVEAAANQLATAIQQVDQFGAVAEAVGTHFLQQAFHRACQAGNA